MNCPMCPAWMGGGMLIGAVIGVLLIVLAITRAPTAVPRSVQGNALFSDVVKRSRRSENPSSSREPDGFNARACVPYT